jgi:PPOX class probable F420-dependent enzyme
MQVAQAAHLRYTERMSGTLADERYVNLESFKRDGNGVLTPVWCAPLDGNIVVFSAGSAYKVKRVRRNPRVRVAACDVRGKLRGAWHEGSCVIVEDPAQQERAYAALRAKYGWQMKLTDFFAGLTGRKSQRAVLEITLQS